jgi:hypothetical protein
MRRVLTCLAILLLLFPVGLAVRFAPLHLPWFWAKYLGSMLWAAALYWLIAAVLPRATPALLAGVSGFAATIVEFSRLVPERHMDAFRLTLAGKLLLGRYFSVWNIAAYLLAIAIAAAADARFTERLLNAKWPPRNG